MSHGKIITAKIMKKKITPENSEQPLVPVYPEPLSLGKIAFKATALALFFAFCMLFLTAVAIGLYVYKEVRTFAKAADTTIPELRQLVETSWDTTPVTTNDHKNILLLGIDSLATRGDVPPLSDTMMLVSLNIATGQFNTLALPRDLWSDEYKTKINALYAYGIEKYPDQPEKFPTDVISNMTGLPIHHTIVLSLDTVSQVIDELGGLEIEVPEEFTDTQFPRTDVDVTIERDPAKLYETITFEQGKQTMNGERTLKYIRSRHSQGTTGTDTDRGKRQQLVISALLAKISNPTMLKKPEQAGKLLLLYKTTFADAISLEELIATAKTLLPVRKNISIKSGAITIFPDDPLGVIQNPPVTKYKQWVYEVRNSENFKKEIQTNLGIIQ